MATYQTVYRKVNPKGVHGAVANEEKSNRISRTVENVEGIYFGAPVQRGAGDHGVVPFAAGKLMGIAILSPAVPPVANGSTLVDGYPQLFTGSFLTEGPMYVTAGGAVADGDPVFYSTVTRRYVNAAGTNIVGPLPGVLFDTTGIDGDVVELAIQSRLG
jgi:hypothetical protein